MELVVNASLLNNTFWIWSLANYKFSENFNTQFSYNQRCHEILVKSRRLQHFTNLLNSNPIIKINKIHTKNPYAGSTYIIKPPSRNLEKCQMIWFWESHLPFHSSLSPDLKGRKVKTFPLFCTNTGELKERLCEFSDNDTSFAFKIIFLLWPMRKDTGAWSIFWSSNRFKVLRLWYVLLNSWDIPSGYPFPKRLFCSWIRKSSRNFFLFYTWR